VSIYGSDSAPKTELLINGTWTDLSTRPRGEQKITIKRGRANEQSRVIAQSCNASLNNRDGVLSNRNPNSVYYGLLPRNTQMRVSAGTGDAYLKLIYTDSSALSSVSTADKAVLDITGDIDIRADIWPYTWRPSLFMVIASKYQATSDQRSWVLYLSRDGLLKLRWYTAGTLTPAVTASSTTAVPASSGRLSIRATLDVDNGAAGNTVTFYTSPTSLGTWTQLGSAVVTAGTTAIFSTSADLVFGGGEDSQRVFSDGMGFGGRFFKGEVYNGIAGTRVANMDATSRAAGDTTWSDALATPNTWTLTSGTGARITSDRIRFTGELSSLPQVWDKTGADVYVPVQASGMIRRLTQGAKALDSPMRRNFGQYDANGYWPLEDGADATSAASAVNGGTAASCTAVTFGSSSSGLPGASSVAQFQDATSLIRFSSSKTTSTGFISCVFYVNLTALPASQKVLMTFYTTGTVRQVRVGLGPNWETTFLASDGTVLATSNVLATGINPAQGWVGYNLLMQTSGSDITYSIRWDVISTYGGGVGPVTISSATLGVPTGGYASSAADSAFNDAKISHIFLSTQNLDLSSDAFRKASSAWINETAADRLVRLAAEEGIPIEIWGVASDSELMGPQLIDTFMNNVYDCWDTDGGIGGECRDKLSLLYRTRTALENRADVTFDYATSPLSEVPLPTEDDSAFTNDVTASRTSGSSANVQNTDGPTSVSDPPDGVGRYATAITRNVATDDHLPYIAGWAVLTGSWDDARYPSLAVAMHRTEITSDTTLTAQVMGLEIGDTANLTHLPAWLPPDDVPELVQGYTETLGKFTWDITYNCTPAGPYAFAPRLDANPDVPLRLDATTHSIGGTMTTTATSVTFVTPAGSQVWADSVNYPAEFPFDVKIAGEVMTVTDITGTSSPQTATLTRSVNGIVKTHASGELVRLAVPSYVGR